MVTEKLNNVFSTGFKIVSSKCTIQKKNFV